MTADKILELPSVKHNLRVREIGRKAYRAWLARLPRRERHMDYLRLFGAADAAARELYPPDPKKGNLG